MEQICQGVKADGKGCTYRAVQGQFCKIHGKTKPAGNPCVTITFGDVCENHARMQKIGTEAEEGFSLADLEKAQQYFLDRNCLTELHDLSELLIEWSATDQNAMIENDPAYLLVVRGGANILLEEIHKNAQDMMNEQLALKWDTKAKMKGKVVNKVARHNLCYAEESQVANYEAGKGTVVKFADLPCLNFVRKKLSDVVGKKGEGLLAEGNLYFDANKCGISGHGDSERKLVIAVRLGESMPMQFHWFLRSKQVGRCFKTVLNHGDMYIMSAKAVGTDWKRSSILTLRHAAGCQKYLFE